MPVSPHADQPNPVSRLRVTFSVHGAACYVSHLDQTRAWVRALRRLGLPLAYSHGFNPHPRISVATPLAVGVCGQRELLDLFFDAWVDPHELSRRLPSELHPGFTVHSVDEIPLNAPPLPSLVTAADYTVRFLEPPPADLALRVEGLLAAESLPFTRLRQDKASTFDLRPRILAAELVQHGGELLLALRLVHGPSGAARPDDVVAALGIEPLATRAVRTGLVLAEGRTVG